ncbi:uncharacterized protein LOC105226713 isoform X6 [Bactrocera dorsalis]|uniref:Uncharacterized protein LOC105226713 isoform X6 n=1 Tax=Bactrocera dorsalis TaxID=27457 RepID=A0ABM3JFI1_BACDO|nr:uncharacterized protein LOC105226713 isoform X6 [Bactrocera dorsalis]
MPNLWTFLSIFLVFSSVYANHCTIKIPQDVPQKTPIILTNTGLFRPTSAETRFEENDKITLHCTGSNNKVLALNEAIVTLECINGNFRYMEWTLKDMKCDSVPTSELLPRGAICAADAGVFYEVGFSLGVNWYPIFKICVNQTDQRTIYTSHLINVFERNDRAKKECRPSYFKSDVVGGNLNVLYTKLTQLTRFEALFGANQKFIDAASFLARGHIVPVADFIFCYEQYATFYYANAAPEWQVVNSGNWRSVENAVRDIASKQSYLLVFTGTLGVLELRNSPTDQYTNIYLDENQTIAVPKWFYKVVMHPSLDDDIVFITLNNPFDDEKEEFCNNICSRVCNKHKLDCSTFTDTITGYTFCCELKDFWANAAMGVGTPYYELPVGWSYKN